jgi:uncharacterized protein
MDAEKKTFVLVQGAWHGGWFRACGNEQREFDTNGLMPRREGSINDVPIRGSDRKFHRLAGPRPADHGGFCEAGARATNREIPTRRRPTPSRC